MQRILQKFINLPILYQNFGLPSTLKMISVPAVHSSWVSSKLMAQYVDHLSAVAEPEHTSKQLDVRS